MMYHVIVLVFMVHGLLLCITPVAAGQEITPADVYYLAQSIDDTLLFRYGLSDQPFQKKRLSDNLKPRNVFQKALAVVSEFNVLHNNGIDQTQIEAARRIDLNTATPREVYGLLNLIKHALEPNGMFMEFAGERSPKTSSDVFHILRQISWHHLEIAKQKGLATNWGTPAQVYEAVVKNVLPAVQSLADDSGVTYEDYAFPPQPISGLVPRNVYKLLAHTYRNLVTYYERKKSYDSLDLLMMTECDELSPADVFDLVEVITAELRAEIGIQPLQISTAERYAMWKETHETVEPGHVFRLMQYNYLLTRRVLDVE